MRFPRTWYDARENGLRHPYERRQLEPEPVRRRLDWRLATIPVAGFTTGWGIMELLAGIL